MGGLIPIILSSRKICPLACKNCFPLPNVFVMINVNRLNRLSLHHSLLNGIEDDIYID